MRAAQLEAAASTCRHIPLIVVVLLSFTCPVLQSIAIIMELEACTTKSPASIPLRT
jgi:hypothetical protein